MTRTNTRGRITLAPERSPAILTPVNDEWGAVVRVTGSFIRIDSRRSLSRRGTAASTSALDRQFVDSSPEFQSLEHARARLESARARLVEARQAEATASELLAEAVLGRDDGRQKRIAHKRQAEARAEAELITSEIAAIERQLPRLWQAANTAYTAFHTAAEKARATQGAADRDVITAQLLAAIAPYLDQLVVANAAFERSQSVDSQAVLGPKPIEQDAPADGLTPPILVDNRLKPEHRGAVVGPEPAPTVTEFAFGGRGSGWHAK